MCRCFGQFSFLLNESIGRCVAESLFLGGIALSGQTLAVAVGATVGTALCLVLILIVGICIKYRRYKALRNRARQSPSLGHLTGTHRSQGNTPTDPRQPFMPSDP